MARTLSISELVELGQRTASGCLVWPGWHDPDGYACYGRAGGRLPRRLHKRVWEAHHGPVPPGHELDHLCRNRGCYERTHLEAVTPQVNQHRGFGVSGKNVRKTHCPQGHAYDWVLPNGERRCRQCATAKTQEWRQRHREELLARRREQYAHEPERHRAYARRYWHEHREELVDAQRRRRRSADS